MILLHVSGKENETVYPAIFMKNNWHEIPLVVDTVTSINQTFAEVKSFCADVKERDYWIALAGALKEIPKLQVHKAIGA